MTPAVHFAAFAENAGPSSSSPAQSSPSKQGAKTVPLGLAKTVGELMRTISRCFHTHDQLFTASFYLVLFLFSLTPFK